MTRTMATSGGSGSAYNLPTASDTVKGGIKIGARLTMTGDVLSANVQAGGGDVLGPATNTADYLPQWNGTDSKTLKNGVAIPAGGLAGLTALGTKLDSSAFSDAGVTGKLITGFTSGAGALAGTDSILQAIQKLDGNVGTKGAGTVTSVAAITLGTTGTDLSSTVATGTTTPVITLQVPTASATNRGVLSAADWSTFNGKQAAGSYLTSVGTGVANELTYWSGTNTLGSLATATYPSLTELSYVKGVTSGVQSQLNGKQATLTNPITGTGTTNELSYWASASTQGTLPVATYPSLTELSYVKGVTSGIQSQLNGKQASGSYLTSLAGAVLTDQTSGQTIGATGTRLTKLWATDITVTNAITGSVTGNAGTVTNGIYTTSQVTALAASPSGDKGKYLHANASTGALEFSAVTGTGDVVGPASNSADYLPQWDGANSKTLKNGVAIPTGGLAGLTSPAFTTPNLGTPSAGTLTNCTELPAASVVAGSLVANMEASDHGTGTTDMLVNVCYGTSATPPTASGTTEGTIYLQYTA